MVKLLIILMAVSFAESAIYLSLIGGILGIFSIVIVFKKLGDFDAIAERQSRAVTELDSRVNRIEGKLHRDGG